MHLAAEQYMDQTRWSDHALVIPLLFDFYHGIEVLLKGFLVAKRMPVKKSHRLSALLSDFNSSFPSNGLDPLLAPYLDNSQLRQPLAEFCAESSITIDDYYQALKYPEGTSGKAFKHTPLKHRGRAGVTFFESLVEDIGNIRREAVALGTAICPNA